MLRVYMYIYIYNITQRFSQGVDAKLSIATGARTTPTQKVFQGRVRAKIAQSESHEKATKSSSSLDKLRLSRLDEGDEKATEKPLKATSGNVTSNEQSPDQLSERGRIWFRRARFQTLSSVSFLALTEFRGESSVSSFQPMIRVPKRTHRVSCRTQ